MSPIRASQGRQALAASLLAPLPLPAAILLATLLPWALGHETAARAETLFLALWSAAVFAPLAFVRRARTLAALFGTAAAGLVLFLPRAGGLRPVAVGATLVLAVVCVGVVGGGGSRSSRGGIALPAALLALAIATLLYGPRLFSEGLTVETLFAAAILPAVAATIGGRLVALGRPGAGLSLALVLLFAPALVDEPWWTLLAVATAASLASLGPALPAAWAGRALVALMAAALLAGSFPWLRPAPIATLVTAALRVDRLIATMPVRDRAVVLTAKSPVFEAELSGEAIRGLLVDSYLTHSVELPCGAGNASIELRRTRAEAAGADADSNGAWHGALLVGRDSAEWAAGRPDVRAALACPAPAPWVSWIPGAGRFFGQTTRSRLRLPEATAARSIRIERDPALPAETAVALFFVATER